MSFLKQRISFNRNELSGAFGDIGTDIPLLIGMILVTGLNPLNVFMVFGTLQIVSAIIYGIPMPLQPLKAVAAVTIAMGLSGESVIQAGLLLGMLMLVLTLTGCIDFISRVVPNCVIRGIQFGLGIKLSLLALTVFIPSYETTGILISAVSFVFIMLFAKKIKYPPMLIVLIFGALAGTFFLYNNGFVPDILSFSTTGSRFGNESLINLLALVVLPQIALSIGNSLLATKKLVDDFFPKQPITENKLSLSYSIFNIVTPFLGGIPVCHGSGGLAGHYKFGARTGGSLVIYGAFLILLGILFHQRIDLIFVLLPLPILGVILLFEGITIGRLVTKTAGNPEFIFAILIGFTCAFLKYGFITGLVAGTLAYFLYQYIQKRYVLNAKN